jgi:hypothetical protein
MLSWEMVRKPFATARSNRSTRGTSWVRRARISGFVEVGLPAGMGRLPGVLDPPGGFGEQLAVVQRGQRLGHDRVLQLVGGIRSWSQRAVPCRWCA